MSALGTKLALLFPSFFTAIGSFIADFNETHVRNPNWPPHARYHNGQTMSMSLTLCALTLYSVLRIPKLRTVEAKRESLVGAWVAGSLYCLTGLSAYYYPGSSGGKLFLLSLFQTLFF